MKTVKQDWQEVAAAKRASLLASIPPKWLIPKVFPTGGGCARCHPFSRDFRSAHRQRDPDQGGGSRRYRGEDLRASMARQRSRTRVLQGRRNCTPTGTWAYYISVRF